MGCLNVFSISQIDFIANMPTVGATNIARLNDTPESREPIHGSKAIVIPMPIPPENTPPITISPIPASKNPGVSCLVIVPLPMAAITPYTKARR